MQPVSEKIVIVGAGLVGSACAICLAQRGHKVVVYDKGPDIRKTSHTANRSSLNLTLTMRGLVALDRIGIGNKVRDWSVPAYGRMIHRNNGTITFQPYGNNDEALYSIKRKDLNKILLKSASDDYNIEFRFNTKCLDINPENTTLKLHNTASGDILHEYAERIIGADGAFSAVRERLQRTRPFNYSQQYIEYGYKEINVPNTLDCSWVCQKNALHFWPRGRYMIVGMPNTDGSFTLSLHMPIKGALSLDSIRTKEDLNNFFRSSFPDIVPFAPWLDKEYFACSTNQMVTIKCYPWSHKDKVVLIGDAAHAIVPFYGQGANAGFEDCSIFCDCIDRYTGDWQTIFSTYEDLRKPNADAIADIALGHLTEISGLIDDPSFLLRKKVERKLNKLYPDLYSDLYSMVAFSCIPYAEALRINRSQKLVIDTVLEHIGSCEELDEQDMETLIVSIIEKSGLFAGALILS